MTDELIPGGPTPQLPEGWKVAWGYPANVRVLWCGIDAVPSQDVDDLLDAGWEPEESTFEGILNRAWTAKQYDDAQQVEALEPHEVLEHRIGGEGSAAYKFQHLPEGCVVVGERIWITDLEGALVRSKGGEVCKAAYYDEYGDYHYAIQQAITAEYDAEQALYVIVE